MVVLLRFVLVVFVRFGTCCFYSLLLENEKSTSTRLGGFSVAYIEWHVRVFVLYCGGMYVGNDAGTNPMQINEKRGEKETDWNE